MPWSTLFNRRVVFDTIELTDWQMHVETLRDGTHNFPKLTPRGPRGRSSWTTTLRYVNAGRGQFTYQDHNTPWGIVARNLDVTVARPGNEYVGQASFSDGLTMMQGYVPFRTDMQSTFKIEGGRVLFDRIDLDDRRYRVGPQRRRQPDVLAGTDAAGEVHDRPPEDAGALLRGRDLQAERARASSPARFTSSKSHCPDGKTRTGRELKGDFVSTTAGVNDMRFDQLRGTVRWTPEVLRISEATTKLYGGDARFTYLMAPLNAPGVTPRATLRRGVGERRSHRVHRQHAAGRHPAGGPPVGEERARVADAALRGSHRQGGAAHHAARRRHADDA